MADKSLFNRLKRLFSTNVIIRNVQGKSLKVTDTERIQSFSDLNTNFLKSRGLAGFHSTVGRYGYNELATISMQRLVLFRDYDLMESDPIIACLHKDTRISTLEGFFTIEELSKKYSNGENFEVWSWDRDTCKYTIGQAHHPRKSGIKRIIKLILNNGNFLECTIDHKILKYDGEYEYSGKLIVGDKIMPSPESDIVCIENIINENKIVDVYDLTVDLFENFALECGIIVSNSALDVYADECLGSETIIPLLDGRKYTIKELYDLKENNFWIYSLNPKDKTFLPAKCEYIKYNGKKKMYNIIFEDGTSIKASENHLWVSKNNLIYTSDLKKNDSIIAFPTKKSDNSFMKGYEMIMENGKWKFTHREVAKNIPELIQKKEELKKISTDVVLHHASFNKLNNSPEELQWLEYSEHRKMHSKYNKELWSDPEKSIEFKDKIRKFHEKYWTKEKRDFVSKRQKNFMIEFISTLTKKERKDKYGLKNEKNGMFKKGYKIFGNKNGRFIQNVNRIETINTEKYIEKLREGYNKKQLGDYFNLLINDVKQLNINLCQNFGYKSIKEFNPKVNNISVEMLKNDLYNLSNVVKNPLRNVKIISNKYNVTTGDLIRFLNKKGYKNFSDLYSSLNNHRILSVEYCGEEDAYDLVNTGDTHIYAIEANDGSKIFCHNSSVKNEFGDILTIKSDDDKIKDVLHNLFYDILNIEFNIWPWMRTLCKYGDHFLKLEISENYGIVNVIPVSPYEMTREEGFDPENPFRVKFKHEGLLAGQLEYENYEIAHFRLANDPNFLPYGKCLAPETYVDTECGSKMIKDITTEDKVWTFNSDLMIFELSNILHKIDSGEKNIIRISTQHNFIDCSENHPILVFDDNTHKLEYKKAIDIKLKDLLIVSNDKIKKSKEYYINKNLSGDFNKNGWKNDINLIPTIVDVEFAELFGFLIGDGWINADVNSVHFAMGMDEELNNKYISLLEKYSGKKICKSKIKLNSNSRSCWINSKMLAQILKNNGFNGTAHTKRIPYWIFESDENIRKAFIIGLTNADGSMSTDEWCNRYAISLCNKELILDFKKLIQTLNIKTSIPVHKYYNEKIEICGVECNSTETHYFYYYLDADEKNQIKKYNKLNLDETSKFILEPVKKIEDFGLSKTYDIQVDNKNSNFIANGIVVHNSMIESGRRVWKQLQLMEDAMLIHRIMRAPEKRIFRIDTGNIPPNETEQYIKNVVNKIKKVPYVDPRTGEYNLKYNMMNMTEDFFIPVRGGDSGTSIESLPGLEYNAIEDIEYLRNKMMASLKIPKAFLGYEEGIGGKCLHPDTKIPLLNGDIKTIKEISDEFKNNSNSNLWVYSYDVKTNSIIPGKIVLAEKTRLNAKLVKVILDNGESVILTPDHGFVLTGGAKIEAQNLKPGDSLQAVYRRNKKLAYNANKYEQIYQPEIKKWVWTHKMIDEYFNGKIENNPEFAYKLRGSRLSKSFEERSEITKKGWTPERLQITIDTNKKYNKADTMMSAYKEKFKGQRPDLWKENSVVWVERPSIKNITNFIENYSGDKNKINRPILLAKKMGYSLHVFEDAIKNSGWDIIEFFNEYIGFKKGRPKNLRKERIQEIISGYNNINNFYSDLNLGRKSIKTYENIIGCKLDNFINSSYNHKVISVEFLNETSDTYNMEVFDENDNHNFLISSGIILKNSTLAAEDVRFAKTIERIQKIFVSELAKIAVIHLYTQGFEESDIVNFELSLTNPSTIYEQEKIALWQEKVSLIRDMQDIKLLSNDWIYKEIINLSQDEIERQKQKVLDDIKNTFRMGQIESEGNDPLITNQTFGTPHDLAMLNKGIKNVEEKPIDFGETNFKMNWDDSTTKNQNKTDDDDYDKEYNKNQREEPKSKYGQDSHVRGRDPIGKQQYNTSLSKPTRKEKMNPFANINKEGLDSKLGRYKTKDLIKESLKNTESDNNTAGSDDKTYLDESNLLEL